MRLVLGFVLISGFGWLFDMATYTVLVNLFDAPPFAANFASSYVGVTFVWLVSLRRLFDVNKGYNKGYLLIYWLFQFISISAYSQGIHWVAAAVAPNIPAAVPPELAKCLPKVLITPFNLFTNFLFMRYLTGRMHKPGKMANECA